MWNQIRVTTSHRDAYWLGFSNAGSNTSQIDRLLRSVLINVDVTQRIKRWLIIDCIHHHIECLSCCGVVRNGSQITIETCIFNSDCDCCRSKPIRCWCKS